MREFGAGSARQQELLRKILDAPLPEGAEREALAAMGVEPTYAALILAAVVRRAAEKADMDSLRYIRDSLGDKPAAAGKEATEKRAVGSLELDRLSDAELELLADREAD